MDNEPSLLHFVDKQIKLAYSLHASVVAKSEIIPANSLPPVYFLRASIAFSSLIHSLMSLRAVKPWVRYFID